MVMERHGSRFFFRVWEQRGQMLFLLPTPYDDSLIPASIRAAERVTGSAVVGWLHSPECDRGSLSAMPWLAACSTPGALDLQHGLAISSHCLLGPYPEHTAGNKWLSRGALRCPPRSPCRLATKPSQRPEFRCRRIGIVVNSFAQLGEARLLQYEIKVSLEPLFRFSREEPRSGDFLNNFAPLSVTASISYSS